ncbi:MAG: hypothetical protein WA063_05970 [Minisyncoccia bacterium]
MKELRKQRFGGGGGNPIKPKLKLARGTKVVSFIFCVMTILITAGIMRAANVYYDLDTTTIMVNDKQSVAGDLTVTSGNVSFSTAGTINQSGTGQVTFGGNVNATNGLDVTVADLTVGGTNFSVAQATGNVATKGTISILETGATPTYYTIFQGGDQTVASNITYTLPVALPGATGYSLVSSNTGTLSWAATVAGTAHPLLGATAHSDTVDQTITRGSLIVGNATPKWDELTLGTAGKILRSDGTDAVWSATTFAEMATANQLLFSSAANTVTGVTAGTSGQLLVASVTGVPTFVTMGTDATITAAGALTISADAVLLGTDTTGNYVASLASGSGLTGGAAGSEGATLTLSLGNLTADWTQTGAYDIVLGNIGSELKIMGSGGTYYGIFDVGNITTADKTYTFPDKSGTVAMRTDVTSFGAGILRGQVNIFGFDYPTQCSTSCDFDTYATISRDIIALPNFPAVLTGKTRSYKLVVRYADDLTVNGDTIMQIWNTSGTPAEADHFHIAGLAADGDLDKGKVIVSDDLTIPLTGDDWEVRVMVPAVGDIIRIYSLELAAYDID